MPEARLTPSQLAQLEKINSWLFHDSDHLIVPLRERSLEIFDDEKKLDALVLTTVFGGRRLSLDTLRARRAIPRLYTEQVGSGNVLLVVENSDTFDSLTRALQQAPGRVGLVGWGAGGGFEASVLSIAHLEPRINEIRYFGDLDHAGLRIPTNADRLAQTQALAAVQPAVALYEALLRQGRPRPGQRAISATTGADIVSWLDPAHQSEAAALLQAGKRMAQEAIGLKYLLSHDDWRQI